MKAPVVAVVGGGQLARMMAPAAGELGIHLRALVEADDGATAQVVPDSRVGAAKDTAALESLIAGAGDDAARVLTFEHEHVPNDLLARFQECGTPVHPGPAALRFAQDKIAMRVRLTELGLPCPRWAEVPRDPVCAREVIAAFIAAEPEGRAVLKTSRGGYDGKGVRIIATPDEAADWIAAAGRAPDAGRTLALTGTVQPEASPQLLIEAKVPFTRELAALVARNASGEVRTWPVVESIQRGGVCSEVISPAPGLSPELESKIRVLATDIAVGLDVTGVLAVELFEAPNPATGEPEVLVNELAMRPHNSGHWTINGAVTSQFEQHLRAVLDWPLGSTEPTAQWTVMANVLGSSLASLTDALPAVLARFPEAKVNLYGKEIRQGRKLGHVNVCGTDLDEVRAAAMTAAAMLRGE